MKIIPLAGEEAARSGWNTVINLKVTATGVGDIATAGAIANVTAAAIGTICQCAGVDVKTTFAGMTTPTLDVGFANTGTGATNIVNATSLSAVTTTVANPTAAVTTASQFLTVRNNGSVASATAGEANVYLRLVDITQGRNSFA
jgi:hypothetical protein